MSDVALLNPQIELELCQRMMAITRSRLEREEQKLTSVPLDRAAYLQTFGATTALRDALDALEHEYRSFTNK